MMGCRPASRLWTTKRAGRWRSENSLRLSKAPPESGDERDPSSRQSTTRISGSQRRRIRVRCTRARSDGAERHQLGVVAAPAVMHIRIVSGVTEALRFVGIEHGRARFRWGVTVPTLEGEGGDGTPIRTRGRNRDGKGVIRHASRLVKIFMRRDCSIGVSRRDVLDSGCHVADRAQAEQERGRAERCSCLGGCVLGDNALGTG